MFLLCFDWIARFGNFSEPATKIYEYENISSDWNNEWKCKRTEKKNKKQKTKK